MSMPTTMPLHDFTTFGTRPILTEAYEYSQMGDSDEEFESRRSGRDKFQRERPTDSGGRDRRSSRDSWESSDRNRTRSDG